MKGVTIVAVSSTESNFWQAQNCRALTENAYAALQGVIGSFSGSAGLEGSAGS
jgi:hypothetical protein